MLQEAVLPAREDARQNALGLTACTALVVGNMIGSGIFLLPASLAAFGPISLAGWVLTSLGALVLAVIFGRLSRLVMKTGGPYAYTEAGYGDFAGFIIAWGYWIALWTGATPALRSRWPATSAFSCPSRRGFARSQPGCGPRCHLDTHAGQCPRRRRGRFCPDRHHRAEAGAAVVLIGTIGLLWIDPANYTPVGTPAARPTFPPSRLRPHSRCGPISAWKFATVPAGEVVEPEKTIPRATIIGVLIAAAVYIAVTAAVAIGVVPSADLARSSAPLADVSKTMWGPLGGRWSHSAR